MGIFGSVHDKDFEDRGLENVKLQVKHANFSPEKDKAARRWIRSQETFYQRVTIGLTILGIIVATAAIFYKK